MRLLGIDYGSKKIGVAITDEDGRIAFPFAVLINSEKAIHTIKNACEQKKVGMIVFGHSISYSREENPIASEAKEFAKKLEEATEIPTTFFDETLTTAMARRTQGQHSKIDASAAALILDSYLKYSNRLKDKKTSVDNIDNTTDEGPSFVNIIRKGLFSPVYVKERLLVYARGVYARHVLFWVSFAESSFFIIPPDVLLVAMILGGARSWWGLTIISTAGSVLGGIVGYGIGAYLFTLIGEPIISFYSLEESFNVVERWYDAYSFWTIFVAAFTPIPYKLFTLTAGLFNINFFAFLVASIIGRMARFGMVSYLAYRLGGVLGNKVFRYIGIGSILVIAIIVILLNIF